MAHVFGDNIKETSAGTGTPMALSGAEAGYKAFSTFMANGDTTTISIRGLASGVSSFETGKWSYNSASNQLERVSVYESSNANAAVSWDSGTKTIICDSLAQDWQKLASGTGAPQFGTIELGHATDTTLSRLAAGRFGVEGEEVITTKDLSAVLSEAQRAAVRASLYAAPFDAVSFNGMQINGGAAVSQELGTTGATLTNNTLKYVADMWETIYNHGAATAVVTSGQIAAASFGATLNGYTHGIRIKATTAISSIANDDFARYRIRIEGSRTARLAWGTSAAQSVSIAFWFYAMRTATHFFRIFNNAGNRYRYVEFSVVAGWNLITKTVPGDTSGTWVTDSTGAGLILEIFGAGKSASPATPDAWGTTNAQSTTNSNGSNQYSTANDETVVTGLVVLPGIELPSSDRLPLLMRPFDDTLMQCLRHWEKSYSYATALGAATSVGSVLQYSDSGAIIKYVTFNYVLKRAVPTLSFYNHSTGTVGKFATSAGEVNSGTDNIGQARATATNGTAYNYIQFHFVSNARL